MTGEWSTQDELAALSVEVAHHHYRATLAANGVKRHRLPDAIKIPRPDPWTPEPEDTAPARVPRQTGRPVASTVGEVVAVLAKGFGRG